MILERTNNFLTWRTLLDGTNYFQGNRMPDHRPSLKARREAPNRTLDRLPAADTVEAAMGATPGGDGDEATRRSSPPISKSGRATHASPTIAQPTPLTKQRPCYERNNNRANPEAINTLAAWALALAPAPTKLFSNRNCNIENLAGVPNPERNA